MKRREHAAIAVITVGVTLAWVVAENSFAFIRVAENWLYDLRVATLGEARAQSEQIVVVAITEDTLDDFPYRTPVDRGFLSDLLHELSDKHVRMIGLDVLFDQPTEPQKDAQLQATLRSLAVPIVVAWAAESDGLSARQASFLERYLRGVEVGTVDVVSDGDDETVRAIPLWRDVSEARLPSLSLALALKAGLGRAASERLYLDYRRGPNESTPPFPIFPAHTVALLPPRWLRGKVVLVGADLPLADRHRTPLSVGAEMGVDARLPGVVVHAHALSQLFDGRRAPRLTEWQSAAALLLLSGFGALIAALKTPAPARGALALAALAGAWILGFYLYRELQLSVPLVVPSLGFVTAGGITQAYFLSRERGQRRFIQRTFGKYLAPAVVERLVADPTALMLSGEERELTLLFTDIEGFTPLTERLSPRALVGLLDEYLDRAAAIVLTHGGTIDKFVGDAMHVMFNAPEDLPEHASAAVRCALALDQFSRAFIAEQRARGIGLGATRIGVNTGAATVGNVGGNLRFDYTAHGSAVNLTARLESANKHLGTRICVSGETKRHCNGLLFRPIGRVSPLGIADPVDVFEPLGDERADRAPTVPYLEAYSLMVKGDPAAQRAFEDLHRACPGDALVALHARRLAAGQLGDLIVLEEK